MRSCPFNILHLHFSCLMDRNTEQVITVMFSMPDGRNREKDHVKHFLIVDTQTVSLVAPFTAAIFY